MNIEQAEMVHRLEVVLPDLRKIAGIKGVELANMLGLSRQAINTLEKQSSRLTLAQYIAIRHIFDAWIQLHPENKTLPRVITLTLDDRRIFGHKYTELLEAVRTIAATSSGGANHAATDVIAKILLDEWEGPAREYCYQQLEEKMTQEKVRVTAETEPDDWTQIILDWRKQK